MASHSVNPSPLGSASNAEVAGDVYSDVEDEVDQLDSDSDVDDLGNDATHKKNGLGPSGGIRVPGHTLLPSLRLENIIQADGVTGSLSLSKEGLFILSIATEEFIKRMAESGQLHASAERRSTITYRDMSATTQQYQEFMFLNDTIPTPLPLSEALSLREAKEKELFEEDPAMSTSASVHAPTPATTSSRIKVRARVNGPEKINGSSSTSMRTSRPASRGQQNHDGIRADGVVDGDGDATWSDWADRQASSRSSSNPQRPSHNGIASSSAVRPSPLVNGDSTIPSRSGTRSPQSQDEANPQASPPRPFHSRSSEEGSPWPGQYTGPASGFLQGPGGPFGRVSQNPGRTIYSQQHRTD